MCWMHFDNGFVTSTCHTVQRDEISDEGAAGTMDSDYFLCWVQECLCPVLGNYELGEPRSVVFMDNASTHVTEEVKESILKTGAVLIYGAPYSPHLNPIENYFSLCKACLKRNASRMHDDWMSVHYEALLTVDREIGVEYFRQSQIPGSQSILLECEHKAFVQMHQQLQAMNNAM